MNFRELISAVRSRPGLVVSLLFFVFALASMQSCDSIKQGDRKREILATFTPGVSNLHVAVNRDPKMPASAPVRTGGGSGPLRSTPFIHSTVMVSEFVPQPTLRTPIPEGPYAPTGRLVECELVNSIDSGIPDTPIIGLVVREVWHAGELIIPTGTLFHGRAQLDRIRDRILARGPWVIVWQTGEELDVSGIALNREYGTNGEEWGLTDGSAGLVGDVIRSQSLDEVKLFLATALSGFASGLQSQQSSVLGINYLPGTARNAGLAATAQVMNTYAQQVLETIKRDGVFIRIPAGKQFYVYLTETVDRTKARVAGGRISRESITIDGSRSPVSINPSPASAPTPPQNNPNPFSIGVRR